MLAAVQGDDQAARQLGWDALVRAYWKPVYKYLRLQWRADAEAARDWTQEFFARALEKEFFARFDPQRARFRTFLRVCVDGFVHNERAAQRRQKRGGGSTIVSLDFPTAEGELQGVEPPAPDRLDDYFHREWLRSLFEQALLELQRACAAAGQQRRYEAFRRYDLEAPDRQQKLAYADLARELDATVAQVTNWLHATRAQLRTLLLARLEQLCATDEEFRAEARALFGAGPP
ncbi:MAG TPA: sigma-70 family RNA polymerase sigma factor [Planctomycetota bacterium]|nr:sigma-70 family RNA polymerase sigma factor [Planctomycetota bacterium]